MPGERDDRSQSSGGVDSFLRAVEGSAPTEADPERIAHFRILGRLGSGGMGIVYRAQDEQLRRQVALKMLPAAYAGDAERRQRFLREARAAAALVHPNVAVVHQVGEADGRVYIAMELVDGTTLRQKLVPGGLSPSAARKLALQMARGLAAAHAKGIIHRDLKPENVMVTGSGVVKLLDFGLAKSGWEPERQSELARAQTETQLTREGDVLGSSAYMSPEQVLGMTVDARSDVFAFGIVLYEMLAGSRPFEGATLGEMRAAIAREDPPPLSARSAGVDARLERIVTKCLSKKTEERFADAGAVERALEALPPESQPRRPAMAWVVGALVVGGLVAAGAWTATRRTPAADAPAASSASAPAQPATVASAPLPYDDGATPSTNPEAQRAYESALAAFHGGTGDTRTFLLKAVDLDPGFGAAQLRLMIRHEADWNERVRKTVESESSLSERDRTVFRIIQAGFAGQLTGVAAREKELDEYLAEHPRDEFAIWARWVFAFENDGEDAHCKYLEKVIADHPAFSSAVARFARDCTFDAAGVPAAVALLDRCLAASPKATDCLAARADLHETFGACAELESDARRLTEIRPDSVAGRNGLANALAGLGMPSESVRQALGPLEGDSWHVQATFVPMLEGDFVEVERVAESALKAMQAKGSVDLTFAPAYALIEAYSESGDLAAAGRVGRDVLVGSLASCDGCRPIVAAGLLTEVRGGLLSRGKANAQLAELYKALVPLHGPLRAWEDVYGYSARSAEDAAVALAAYPSGVPAQHADTNTALAALYAWAGRWADARPLFAKAAVSCTLVTSTAGTMIEHLLRGRVDEEAGDKSSACAHYAKILERWDHAKPRSTTADEARSRAKKLGCTF